MSFGNNLQVLRKEKNLSQEKLADDLNVSRQCISKWEMDSAYPETEKLIALSEYFDVSIDTLVKGNVERREEIPDNKVQNNASQSRESYRNIRLVSAVCLILFSPFWTTYWLGDMARRGMSVFMMFLFIIVGCGLLMYNYLSNPKRLKRKALKSKSM